MESLGFFFLPKYFRCLHTSLAVCLVFCQFHLQMPEPSHLGISTKLTICVLFTHVQQETMHLASRKDAPVFQAAPIVS